MSELLKSVKGFLFPLPHNLVERFLSGEKDVFVKTIAYRFLTTKSTIIFYDSDYHAMVGEAKIEKIVCAEPSTIWNEYHSRLFLKKEEFDNYVLKSPLGPRPKKGTMTAFVLGDVKRYPKSRQPPKRVTPSGYYLS